MAPSTEPAWTPSQPVPAAEPWEAALRLPGQIALLPVTLLARAMQGGLHVVEAANVVPRVMYVITLQDRFGLYVSPASLGDRTGFGGALRFVPPAARGALALEASGSTTKFNRSMIRVGHELAHLDYQLDWQPRRQFFGIGPDSRHQGESSYASRIEHLYLNVGRAWVPAGPRRGPRTEVHAWSGPRDVIIHAGRDPDLSSFDEVFTGLASQLEDRRVAHMVYGVHLEHDTRAGRPHWSHGWRAAVSVERFDEPIGNFALRDAHTSARPFTRFTYEGEAGFSFYRDPRTLRLLVRVVDMRLDSGTGLVQLTDLSRLGGSNGLSGFEPDRFQDLDSVLGRLSYVFPLSKHLEMEVHTEWGGVAGDLARLARYESSYGVSLRPRLETAPLGSIGIDWSREEMRLRFAFGGVE